MNIHSNFKGKIKNVANLLAKKYKGFPIGVLVGIIIVAGSSAYAAPMLLNNKSVSSKAVNGNQVTQHVSQSNHTGSITTNTPSGNSTSSSTSQSSSVTSTNTQPNSTSSIISSSSSTTPTPIVDKPTKALPTMTGISVVTSSGSQTVTVNIPVCDFQSINSGTPETCHHYVPLPFSLVAKYSDGSTMPLSWSDATETSLSYDIPKLFSVDASNNTLLEGDGLQYYNYPMNSTLPMNITYQGWTYMEYINVIINSTWGS